jgi:hypothetical protein
VSVVLAFERGQGPHLLAPIILPERGLDGSLPGRGLCLNFRVITARTTPYSVFFERPSCGQRDDAAARLMYSTNR